MAADFDSMIERFERHTGFRPNRIRMNGNTLDVIAEEIAPMSVTEYFEKFDLHLEIDVNLGQHIAQTDFVPTWAET